MPQPLTLVSVTCPAHRAQAACWDVRRKADTLGPAAWRAVTRFSWQRDGLATRPVSPGLLAA
eukprot:11367415-Alexandrium_andersonii.AAC.1